MKLKTPNLISNEAFFGNCFELRSEKLKLDWIIRMRGISFFSSALFLDLRNSV